MLTIMVTSPDIMMGSVMLCGRAVTVMLAIYIWTLMAEACAFQYRNSSQMQENNRKMQPFISNDSQQCSIECNSIRDMNGILSCPPNTSQLHLFLGYCISCSENLMSNSWPNRDKSEAIVAQCPFSIGKDASAASLPLEKDLSKFCSRFGRAGKLCGSCLPNKSIDVMSDSFDCIECNYCPTDWLRFFAVRFASLTVFFIIVIVFHVGVARAPFNGFVFFSQIVSLRCYILLVEAGWNLAQPHHNHPSPGTLTHLLSYPYGVWSLKFMFVDRLLLRPSICLQNLKVFHIIMLDYVIALYPLVLLGIVYVLTELHGRNYRIVVCLWRLLCPVCIRIRRSLKYKSSLIDAFVTFLLLSYTKMAVVSFELVALGPIVSVTQGKTLGKVLIIDPSVSYTHYRAIACIVLIIYGGCFPVFLVLYPSRCFKICLNKFTYCSPRLVQALHTFADAFQGNYKRGQNGEPDRRFFAGVYLWFRMLIFFIMTHFRIEILFYYLLLAYFVLLLFFVIFQPYKVSYYNWLEGSFVAILGIVSLSIHYLYTSLQIKQRITPTFGKLLKVTYYVHFIPLVYIICHIIYWIITCNKCCKKFQFQLNNRLQDATQSKPLLDVSTDFPDRLMNPGNYGSNNVETASNTPLLVSAQDSRCDQYGSMTEIDYQ